jgi:uncharacterized cupredoxin-like copper-binding protein
MRRQLTLVSATAVLAAVALAAVGCGDDSGDAAASTTATPSAATTAPDTSETTAAPGATTPTTTAPAGASRVAVLMGKPEEYSLSALPVRVPAGETTFIVANKGAIVHEMVVVPSIGGAAALRQPDGTASEDGALGEVADVEPGGGGQLTVTMPAGKYVLLCALPGHFEAGMFQNFVVK